jgi:hypothetical protein
VAVDVHLQSVVEVEVVELPKDTDSRHFERPIRCDAVVDVAVAMYWGLPKRCGANQVLHMLPRDLVPKQESASSSPDFFCFSFLVLGGGFGIYGVSDQWIE